MVPPIRKRNIIKDGLKNGGLNHRKFKPTFQGFASLERAAPR